MTTTSTNSPDLEVITVAYRSRHEVEQMLAGLPPDLPVAVVDNFDDGDGLRAVVTARRNGRYLEGNGSGFSRAANLAVRTSQADVLVFVNPDIRPTIEDITALVEDVRSDPGCSASAGILIEPDRRPHWGAGGWEPTLRRILAQAVGLHRLLPRLGLYARPRIGEDVQVDWVCGACMAVRRRLLLDMGCLEEDYFVYNEDMEFGRQSRERGLHQRLRTDVAIHGSDAGSGAPALEMMRLRGASMHRYLRRHHRGLVADALAATLGLGFLARTVVHLVTGDTVGARQHLTHASGLFTGRAVVASRLVMSRRGRAEPART